MVLIVFKSKMVYKFTLGFYFRSIEELARLSYYKKKQEKKAHYKQDIFVFTDRCSSKSYVPNEIFRCLGFLKRNKQESY